MKSVANLKVVGDDTMADPETERAIGRIEGRMGAMETRISEVVAAAMDKI